MNYKNAKKDLSTYLLKYLGNSIQFNNNKVFSDLDILQLKKKEVVLKEGEICKEAFWLQSGYGRFFRTIIDKNDLEYEDTIAFCKPGNIVFVGGSFFDTNPSKFSFEFSKKTVIIPFSKDYYDLLNLKRPEVSMITNRILALDLVDNFTRHELLKMKPRKRYQEFLAFYGVEIEANFAVKQIATYLGMSPNYLSRLRGEFSRRKLI